ncbi:MAG: hypothetical protein DI555_06445 [Novosphingobium pentaromativorans]|uniref:TonB C-terminal domain-containing protein n=1 Tax=Novosphingobium pentaromativorans TaxID=205844 RepID=A0A2W5NWD1_9SPHN|nr:MAG: hypothetical protein DI555_06445 [Novosphingobium pentaromativorans]
MAASAVYGLVPATAQAAYQPETSGWSIRGDVTGCSMSMQFDGPGETALSLSKTLDGEVSITLTNTNWSTVRGQSYDLTYFFGGEAVSSSRSEGIVASTVRRGFKATFTDVEQAFAKSADLVVLKPGSIVDRLTLTGSSAALEQLNRCLLEIADRRLVSAIEEVKFADIARDPFAGGPRDPELANPGLLSAQVSTHPMARSGLSGVVEFVVKVSANGRLLGCDVAKSSGEKELDDATCATVLKYAKFKPAIADGGQPTAGEYRNRVRWSPPG